LDNSFVPELQYPKTGLECLTVEVSRSHKLRHTHTHTHTHTQTFSTLLNEWSAHRRGHYLHTHTHTHTTDEYSCNQEVYNPWSL